MLTPSIITNKSSAINANKCLPKYLFYDETDNKNCVQSKCHCFVDGNIE